MENIAIVHESNAVADSEVGNQASTHEVTATSSEPAEVDEPAHTTAGTCDAPAEDVTKNDEEDTDSSNVLAPAPSCDVTTESMMTTDELKEESLETLITESETQYETEKGSELTISANPEIVNESEIVKDDSTEVATQNTTPDSLSPQSKTLSPADVYLPPTIEEPATAGESEKAVVADDSVVESEVMEQDSLVVPPIPVDEDSCQSGTPSESNTSSQPKRTRVTSSKLMLKSLPQGVGAEALFEYRWPTDDDHAEYWMLQEQLSVFLDIKSFRRKYPDLERRQIDIEERNYLTACGVVTEMQCDLGLTALRSEDISDLMLQDYPDKYDEYAKVLRKREEERLTKRHQEMQELQNSSTPVQAPVTKMDIKKLTEKAVRSAANYNALLARERREERRHYYDIPTSIVQYPKNRKRPLPPEMTRPGTYPVAVLRGQYSDSYTAYSSEELKYLPVKTALYEPPLRIHNPYMPLPPQPEDIPQVHETVQMASNVPQPSGLALANKKPVTKLIDATCVICGRDENKHGNAEKCIRCTECHRETHPTCCELTEEMLTVVLTYNWMCMECKVCVRCSDPGNEDKMIVCDNCDRGYHTFCVGLKSIPEESIWACPECTASA